MAAKKTVTVEEDIKVAEPVEKKAPAADDPWSKKVTIKLDKPAPGQDNYVIASVNGKVFKIKKGVVVDVPAPIAEVIEHSQEAEEAADLYIESKAN